jgi:hypothetical protein
MSFGTGATRQNSFMLPLRARADHNERVPISAGLARVRASKPLRKTPALRLTHAREGLPESPGGGCHN